MRTSPIAPAKYTNADVAAIKAVAAGNASPDQQRRALKWVVHDVARTYDETFVPGQPDSSDHLSGRRNVGLQIMKLVNVDAKHLIVKDEGNSK